MIQFGAFARSLRDQGFDDENGVLQRGADAALGLHVNDLLTRSEMKKVERRIVKRLKPLTQTGENQ